MHAKRGDDTGSAAAAAAAPTHSIAWHTCEACGHWQRGGIVCAACQWPRLIVVSPATAREANHLRVLIETEFRSDGTWHVAGLRTARLLEFVEAVGLVQQLKIDGVQLLGLSHTTGKAEITIPTTGKWEIFRDHSRSVLRKEINDAIQRNWPGPKPPYQAEVEVSIRSYFLDPTATPDTDGLPAWLELIPFHAAAATAAARLGADEILIDCSHTGIGFTCGGERIESAVTAPSELLVNACE